MAYQKVAVVIGGSRGIGAATVEALAANGAAVAVAARKAEACETVIGRVHEAHGEAFPIDAFSCDASNYDAVAALVDAVIKRFGRLDFVINNAGTMDPIGFVDTSDPQQWASCTMLNLVGAFNGCRAVLPHFKKRGSGVIVNLSTGAAFHPLPGWSAYCASKAGLAMFTKTLGVELADSDIRIYGFQPGMVNTEMTRAGLRIKVNRVSELDPATMSSPDVPGRAIAWLCKEQPKDISGGEVDINAPEFRVRAGLG